jgi:putative ABC transport system permease protein
VTVVRGRPARSGGNEVIIGSPIAGRFKGVDPGQTFDLKKNRPVQAVGVFTDRGRSHESEEWTDRDTLRSAFGREGYVSSVGARLESPAKLDGFRLAVGQDK